MVISSIIEAFKLSLMGSIAVVAFGYITLLSRGIL